MGLRLKAQGAFFAAAWASVTRGHGEAGALDQPRHGVAAATQGAQGSVAAVPTGNNPSQKLIFETWMALFFASIFDVSIIQLYVSVCWLLCARVSLFSLVSPCILI